MGAHTSISNKPSDVFKTFPEFSKLTLADRKKYERLIESYPPVANTTFVSLMTWWNVLDSCAVSMLHGNLILSYWLPGDEKKSGLSLVGTQDIDQTICTIFDEMRSKGDRPRLVHVPEYVIENIEHGELFEIAPERSCDEYVMDVSKYYPLRSVVGFRRRRVKRFIERVGKDSVAVRKLDLSDSRSKKILRDFSQQWTGKGVVNTLAKSADEAAQFALREAEFIGIENICLFVDGELYGYMLYTMPADKRYAILVHAMVRNETPYTLDYMVYAFAEWFSSMGVRYVNTDSDLGMPLLRMFKVALGPVNYFRMYTVEPAQ